MCPHIPLASCLRPLQDVVHLCLRSALPPRQPRHRHRPLPRGRARPRVRVRDGAGRGRGVRGMGGLPRRVSVSLGRSLDERAESFQSLVCPLPHSFIELRPQLHLAPPGCRRQTCCILHHEIQQLSALERLYLSENALTGPIPAELGQLEALVGLHLNHNKLSGPIPVELRQLRALNPE